MTEGIGRGGIWLTEKKGEKRNTHTRKKTRFHIVPCVLLPLFLKKKYIFVTVCCLYSSPMDTSYPTARGAADSPSHLPSCVYYSAALWAAAETRTEDNNRRRRKRQGVETSRLDADQLRRRRRPGRVNERRNRSAAILFSFDFFVVFFFFFSYYTSLSLSPVPFCRRCWGRLATQTASSGGRAAAAAAAALIYDRVMDCLLRLCSLCVCVVAQAARGLAHQRAAGGVGTQPGGYFGRRRYESVTRSFIPTLLPGRFPSEEEEEDGVVVSFIPDPIKRRPLSKSLWHRTNRAPPSSTVSSASSSSYPSAAHSVCRPQREDIVRSFLWPASQEQCCPTTNPPIPLQKI